MVVDDAEASRQELVERGVEASDVQVFPWGSFVCFRRSLVLVFSLIQRKGDNDAATR